MQDKKLVQEYDIFVLRLICRARLIAVATVFTVFTVNTNVTYRVWLRLARYLAADQGGD